MPESRIETIFRPVGELTIRPYHPDDESTVLALLRSALAGWPIVEGAPDVIDPVAFFRWKHMGSPFGKSVLVLAEQDGELAGFRAFMPWTLRAGRRTFRALRTVDAVTRPDLQRSGIFGRIRREADAYFPDSIDLHFGTPNDKSLGATLKIGMGGVVGLLCGSRRLLPSRAACGAIPGRTRALPEVDAPPAADTFRTVAGLSALLDDARRTDPCLATAKDVAYLRWRYGDAPLDYRAVCDERGGDLRGIGIFRLRSHRGLCEAVVEELVVRPGDRRTASRILRRIARAAPVALLSGRFSPGSAQGAAARRQGFLPERSGLPLVVRAPSPGLMPAPDRLDSWALSLGDIEVL